MAASLEFEELTFSPDGPFAAEHADLAAWVEDAVASRGESQYYVEVDHKTVASGKNLLDADPEHARRYVMAAVAQVRHWDKIAEQIQATDTERVLNGNRPEFRLKIHRQIE